VVVGEVWMATGQSNMGWRVGLCRLPDVEMAKADSFPLIRLFHPPNRTTMEPQTRVYSSWARSTDEEVKMVIGGIGYFFSRELHLKLGIPVGIIDLSYGGTHIDSWMSPQGWEMIDELDSLYHVREAQLKDDPSSKNGLLKIYNGCLHAQVPYGIRGFIWHQGEGNRLDGYLYGDEIRGLIGGYRKLWNDEELFFIIGQLYPHDPPPFLENLGMLHDQYCRTMFAQALTPRMNSNSASVFLSDLGQPFDIHPREKYESGRRYALAAFAKVYGFEDIVYSGPLIEKAVLSPDGTKVQVFFEHSGSGLSTYDNRAPRWFRFICENGKSYPPRYTQISEDKESVILYVGGTGKSNIVKLTHAWNVVAFPNLINSEGLPASVFEIDIFKE
jgi:sialate O-acetylesterase